MRPRRARSRGVAEPRSLRRDGGKDDALPDPDDLRTADAAFFQRELPGVQATMRRRFHWKFPRIPTATGDANKLIAMGLRRLASGNWS